MHERRKGEEIATTLIRDHWDAVEFFEKRAKEAKVGLATRVSGGLITFRTWAGVQSKMKQSKAVGLSSAAHVSPVSGAAAFVTGPA